VRQANVPKKTKKAKIEKESEDLYYKYEEEHFVQKSEVCFSYKIPYEQKFNDFNENSNEPQYYNLCFIKAEKFLEVVKFLNSN
jgi:hypothetical protein